MESESQVGVIMTVKEVAATLRVSDAKVYRLVKRGALPAARIGKTWRFRKDLLDEWLKECSKSEARARRT